MLERTAYLAFAIALLTLGVWPQGVSTAHEGATGVVKERMEMMKGMGNRMKTIAAMIKGEKAFDPQIIAQNAAEISKHAVEIERLFPEGTHHAPSEAKQIIWAEKNRFVEFAKSLEAKSKSLSQKAEDGDKREIMMGFAAVGKTCSGCHTDFRKEKENK